MQEQQIYTGKIKFFQGQYGFITSEIGDVFFHITGIGSGYFPFIDDDVCFQTRNSNKGSNKLQAFNVSLAQSEDISQIDGFLMIGVVQKYDHQKGCGVISTPFQVDIDGTSTIEDVTYLLKKRELKTYIHVGDICSFRGVQKKGNKKIAQKCFKFDKFLASIVNVNSNFLSAIMDRYLYVAKNLDLIQIVKIAEILKDKPQIKKVFLDTIYSKAKTFVKCELCFQYNLLCLEKEQYIVLLNKYLSEVVDKIENGTIAITETSHLSQCVFTLKSEKKFNPKVNVLCNIDLSNILSNINQHAKKVKHPLYESYEKVCDIDINKSINIENYYNNLKNIIKDENFDYEVKRKLLKISYEKADTEYKWKLAFEDKLVDLNNEEQDKLQQELIDFEYVKSHYNQIKDMVSCIIDETDRQKVLNAIYENANVEYKYKLFENNIITLDKNDKKNFLDKLTSEIYDVGKVYDKIKDIANNENFETDIKQRFLKVIYEKADIEYKYKLIFEDCLISLTNIQQLELLGQYYLNDTDTDINNVWFYGQNPNVWKIRENYAKLCDFAKNENIDYGIRNEFLKHVYSEADITYKYKMLFEDCLIPFDFMSFIKDIPLLKELKKHDADKYKNNFEDNT